MSNKDSISMCANCGKGEEESVNLKICEKCKMVKYCSDSCKEAHREQHENICKEIYDDALFKDHPPRDDCPICLLPLPGVELVGFEICCGKHICSGCILEMCASDKKSGGNQREKCPYCREPDSRTDKQAIKRLKRLMKAGNGEAFNMLAMDYENGTRGMPQDYHKANELFLRGGELGCDMAYHNLGSSYQCGTGVEVDMVKAKHYFELAAMIGCTYARHNLGFIELDGGNNDRAYKHFIISARDGDKNSLGEVTKGYKKGLVSKDEYASTLRAYQKRQDEMKSASRDKVAAHVGGAPTKPHVPWRGG